MRKFIILLLLFSGFTLTTFSQEEEKKVEQTERAGDIIFKSTVYDFGILKYKEEAKGRFIFKNISKEPIKITNVRVSCGCTDAVWSREEIKKRKKSVIEISYDTKRVGKFHKNVFVYVNGNPKPIQLQIRGEVLSEEASKELDCKSRKRRDKKTK